MKKLIVTSICLCFCFAGCSFLELSKYADENTCPTTIEGNYSKEVTSRYGPAVFIKTSKLPRMVKGEIISMDSTGVLFDPEGKNYYYKEDGAIPYDTLYGVVDEAGKVLYGHVPVLFSIRTQLLIQLEKTDTKAISELLLEPNEPFAYCIEPGNYKVKQIKFVESSSVEDVGHDFPNITFNIEAGKANYLGNIFADYRKKGDPNVILIPANRNNESASAAAGMFGLIGSVVYAVANEIANTDYYHVLHMEVDKNFLPEANTPLIKIELDIQAAD